MVVYVDYLQCLFCVYTYKCVLPALTILNIIDQTFIKSLVYTGTQPLDCDIIIPTWHTWWLQCNDNSSLSLD